MHCKACRQFLNEMPKVEEMTNNCSSAAEGLVSAAKFLLQCDAHALPENCGTSGTTAVTREIRGPKKFGTNIKKYS